MRAAVATALAAFGTVDVLTTPATSGSSCIMRKIGLAALQRLEARG